jgi:hypothetical protein
MIHIRIWMALLVVIWQIRRSRCRGEAVMMMTYCFSGIHSSGSVTLMYYDMPVDMIPGQTKTEVIVLVNLERWLFGLSEL